MIQKTLNNIDGYLSYYLLTLSKINLYVDKSHRLHIKHTELRNILFELKTWFSL